MENFNKNWLAILLLSVIFLILGFLLGRVTASPHGGMHKMIKHRIEKDMGEEVTVTVDTVKNDGKNIEVRVEKKIGK